MLPDKLVHVDPGEAAPPERVSRTFRIDHGSGRVVSEMIDGTDALAQAIWVNLSIEKGVWEIHTKEFGVEFSKLYGRHRDYARALIEPIVKKALSWDERVYSAENFVITDEGKDKMLVEFDVYTATGKFRTGVSLDV